MTYGTNGPAKPGKGNPKHSEHNAFGTKKTPYNARPDKAELLARMKANAEAAKKG